MPFKIKWPFRWPWRRPRPAAAAQPADSTPSVPPAEQPSVMPGELPVTRERPGRAREPILHSAADGAAWLPAPDDAGPVTFELGQELLERLPRLSTPPTLGRQGGLPAMAQTLPAVDRFIERLPGPPVQRLLAGPLAQADEFAASLPALASLGQPGADTGARAFPAELPTPSSLTDVLPPLGALPGQAAAMSGQAPQLAPTPPAPREIVRVVTEPGPAPRPPTAEPGAPTPAPAPVLPAVEAPSLWPLTRVLPPEFTLTGNILPTVEGPPIQRELRPGTPAGLGELVEPSAPPGERVTPAQRQAIEGQRGQGQPLAPEIRQRFEPVYGQSLAGVRVHTGQAAHTAAESLNAIAFASGSDLFFTQSAFQPSTPQGLSLIGHELAHVVQQQYGLPGDANALRPADDAFERKADQLAASALETPLAAPSAEPVAGPPVQRAIVGTFQPLTSSPPAPSSEAPAMLQRAESAAALDRPLTAIPPAAEPAPVQRFSFGELGGLARDIQSQGPSLPASVPREMPSLGGVTERVSGLTDQLSSPASMLSGLGGMPSLGSLGGLAQGLPSVGDLTSMLPALPGGLPSLGGLPGSVGELAGMIPGAAGALPAVQSALGGLGGGLPLPSLGGLAQNLPGGLTDILPAVQGGLPGAGALPSLGGLELPEMPLAEGLGGLGQALGGAAGAGQEALGSITSMAPSLPEAPAAPALPSLEKLTEHVWKQVQHKLKVERERARGLA